MALMARARHCWRWIDCDLPRCKLHKSCDDPAESCLQKLFCLPEAASLVLTDCSLWMLE
jgi:hypothetical protein